MTATVPDAAACVSAAGAVGAPACPPLAFRECAAWAVVIFLFCAVDAVCTLVHIGGGAGELNPVMGYLLAMGPQYFVTVKLLVSAVGLGVLCLLLPRIRRGRLCFFLTGFPYLGVCCYHVTGFVW